MSTANTAGNLFFGTCLMAAFVPAGTAEPAATLSQTDGFTVVSKGTQYIEAHEGMALEEGDRLMVLEGGTAGISFADGCKYTLTDNELLTIGPTSTCASTAVGTYKVDPYSGVSQDSKVATVGYQQASIGETGGAGLSWVVPAAVGTVLIVGVAADTGSDDRNPISP